MEQMWPALSVAVAVLALVCTTVLLARQVRQMEHERNALAILEAINRLTDVNITETFHRLAGVSDRYPTDEDVARRFPESTDEDDIRMIGSYIETIAVLARRGALDPSLLVDAVGLSLRERWEVIRPVIERLRRVRGNPFILENFEWLALYSAWWKDVPRSPRERNYRPTQFCDVVFRV
ncbi:MAG: hypothetical protein JO322_01620 [Candidatus Eremiobacteraeota bacterium]|nr:hypothetical protein [Candidatus Eremiobacteraeota bacterium]